MGSRDAHSHGDFHLKTTHVFPFSSIAISNQLRSLSQKEIGDKTFLFSFLFTYGRVSSHAPPSHPQLCGSQSVQRVNVSLIYTCTHVFLFSPFSIFLLSCQLFPSQKGYHHSPSAPCNFFSATASDEPQTVFTLQRCVIGYY